jgi:iron complex transport system ATP-binding protein
MVSVEARDVSFAYAPGPPVLDEVSVRLGSGERVALIGANGAGKSTLLRLLSGALAPRAGTVLWEGKPLAAVGRRTLARLLALVPQNVPGGPLEDLTVEEVAALGRIPYAGWLGLRGERAADVRAVRDALAAVDATLLAQRPLGELSGGERQRAFLALALAQEPRLLLLDEPTRHLDPHHQVALFDLLTRLAGERGLGVVAVLHDLNLAAWYFPRLVLLQAGRIVADGSPAEVLTQEHVTRAYGPGLEVLADPRRSGVPLVLPQYTSPQHTRTPALLVGSPS